MSGRPSTAGCHSCLTYRFPSPRWNGISTACAPRSRRRSASTSFGYSGTSAWNLHVIVQVPGDISGSQRPQVETVVYEPLAAFRGSISAEHGIGLEKKPWLGISRSDAEVALMRSLRQTL
ncbi:MAG: FAD-linked oxidase C-terminal domain-containing protein, partial [Haliea sp.]